MSIAMPAPVYKDAPDVRPKEPGVAAPAPVYSIGPTGRLRQEGLQPAERTWATWTHVSPLLAFAVIGPFAVFLPLVLWLIRRDTSTYIDDHGREVLNLAITGVIVTFLAPIPILGWIGAPIWFVVALINVIRGASAAAGGEYFRYPLSIRFVS